MEWFDSLSEKFSGLTGREKWLILIGGMVGVIMLMMTFLLDPALAKKQQQISEKQSIEQSILRANNEIIRVTQQLKTDPDKEIDLRLVDLKKQSALLDSQFEEIVKNLVTPDQMAGLLEQVLLDSRGLKLHSLESLPAEPVTTSQGEGYAGYYIHPVKIHLSGQYFAIQAYLSKLESMPVRYFWRSFQYQVSEYPLADLTLEVYTLGTGQEFIGG